MNQQAKALISVRAKKFISSQLFITNFYFKGTQQFTKQLLLLQRHTTFYWAFSQPWLALSPLATFFAWSPKQKVAKDDKATHGWENAL